MYTHAYITINSKEISVNNLSPFTTSFEKDTCSFINAWLTGKTTFTLQTSGSTGSPKEIVVTREQLSASAHRTIAKLKLVDNQTALVCLDTKYIAGKMMLARALEVNMYIVVVEPSSNPLKNLSAQPDFGAFVPLQLDEILRDEDSTEKLNQFRSVIIGGASVNPILKEKIKKLSCDVYATYGMTETVSHIALQKLNGSDAQEYFETFPDIKIKIDSRDCLVIELPGFQEPIITNDLVSIIDDHHFKILGRYDNIINSGGIKLVPETIEKKLSSLLSDQSYFIAGIDDDRLGQKLVLIIEGKARPELADALKLALPTYEIPKEIFYLDEFIRTETQKINRGLSLKMALKSRP